MSATATIGAMKRMRAPYDARMRSTTRVAFALEVRHEVEADAHLVAGAFAPGDVVHALIVVGRLVAFAVVPEARDAELIRRVHDLRLIEDVRELPVEVPARHVEHALFAAVFTLN